MGRGRVRIVRMGKGLKGETLARCGVERSKVGKEGIREWWLGPGRDQKVVAGTGEGSEGGGWDRGGIRGWWLGPGRDQRVVAGTGEGSEGGGWDRGGIRGWWLAQRGRMH